MRAARRAGRPLRLIGPIVDEAWFEGCIQPLLGPDVIYEGHLTQADMSVAFGEAAVTLITPRWEEPCGLVAVESTLTGTPVFAIERGGVSEVVDERMGVLVKPQRDDDETVEALAGALDRAASLPRAEVRARAIDRFSIDRMAADYEHVYHRAISRR